MRSTPPRRPRQPSLDDAHLVPRRQALDVGREDVARGDRHAHAQDRVREQAVGRRRARAVDVGELDDEIVDADCGIDVNRAVNPPLRSAAPAHAACWQRSSACAMLEQELLHVPRAGRAALRAQPAVQAHVLVLGHDAAGLQLAGNVEVLREIDRRRLQARAQVGFLAVGGERDAVHRADVDAGIALDAQLVGEHRLHVAVEAALRLGERELAVEAELDFDLDVARARSPCP